MKPQIRTRAAVATLAALVVAGTVTVGISAASPEHDKPSARHKPAAKPSKEQIAALFDQWNAALQTGDAEKVAARYAPDAVLLPTASPKIRTDHDEIVDYFDHFLLKKPKGEKLRSVIEILDNNSAIDAGLYEFHITDPETGKKSTLEARYTYEYEKRDGKWLIVNHHSSVLPPAS
ncbi:SgcJ/EcaC family oxidoreductase [Streptomyces sp. HC44]|uniref:SgcJ/EcaC family oxidoreductase n=2 Tax=Streptomyces scabichelini TaxID=2711217 RepID=A0A6G4UXS1_9ACTN|nr:SgcJ/EcaC family oxidoreductase [Streptomyces scabichelini]NGO06539.1 SgcJ/EcaC family oxidoreductase [Streptomyces scabichelini]